MQYLTANIEVPDPGTVRDQEGGLVVRLALCVWSASFDCCRSFQGLLGNANGDVSDDLRTSSGAILAIDQLTAESLGGEFTRDWRVR